MECLFGASMAPSAIVAMVLLGVGAFKYKNAAREIIGNKKEKKV
jgi:hypothetical protein